MDLLLGCYRWYVDLEVLCTCSGHSNASVWDVLGMAPGFLPCAVLASISHDNTSCDTAFSALGTLEVVVGEVLL